jgi:hypothetical protein
VQIEAIRIAGQLFEKAIERRDPVLRPGMR